MAHNLLPTWTKNIKRGFAVIFAVSFLLGVSGSGGVAQTVPGTPAASETGIELSCQNPGSDQETGKTPIITNTTDNPLAKDQRIAWLASDGDSGQITLQEELPKGGKMFGRGSPGSTYSCQARAQG